MSKGVPNASLTKVLTSKILTWQPLPLLIETIPPAAHHSLQGQIVLFPWQHFTNNVCIECTVYHRTADNPEVNVKNDKSCR